MRYKILVVTSELPPLEGYATAGGGMRAWGLAEALKGVGHDVRYALEQHVTLNRSLPEELCQYTYTPTTLQGCIEQANPDILVFEHWEPLSHLPPNEQRPVIADVPGSLVLEHFSRGIGNLRSNAMVKLRSLARADIVVTTSPLCRAYLIAWLVMAGWSPTEIDVRIVPISLPPHLPELQGPCPQLTAHFAGIAWPWQDPTSALETIRATMERCGTGVLKITTGKHPVHVFEDQVFSDLATTFSGKPCIEVHDLLPHFELFALYQQGDFAVDLMKRTPERELASTVRTVGYLWSGLPTLVSDYTQLAPLIAQYDAGWVVNPDNLQEVADLVAHLLTHPEEIYRKRTNAQRLAREKLCWDRTVEPLAQFCEAPFKRIPRTSLLESTADRLQFLERMHDAYQALQTEVENIKDELCQTRTRAEHAEHDLSAIRSKLFFKIYKRINKWVLGD